MKNKNDEIDDILNDNSTEQDGIIQSYVMSTRYDINLDGDIEEPSNYRKAFDILKKASGSDVVCINISTYGGDIFSFIMFHNLLLQCNAATVANLYSAFSAGSLIALSCDNVITNKHSSMMAHSIIWGSSGKAGEIIAKSDFLDKWNKEVLSEVYQGFLTEKEIDSLIQGKDYWFVQSEIDKRLKNWIPIRERAEKGKKK